MAPTVMVALGLALAPLTAAADGPIPVEARELADRGRELHDQGEYAGAIAAFKKAYQLAPSPGLLFNLAQAYRLQGNCDEAVVMYRKFIAANPWPEARALAEAHLETVERCAHKRAPDAPVDRTPRRVKLPPVPPPPPPALEPTLVAEERQEPSRSHSHVKHLGLGVALGGTVALSGALYYALRAYNAEQDVERAYVTGAKWQDIHPVQERGEAAATRARWLGIGGGVAVATGVTLWVLGARTERTVPVTVARSSGGAEVTFTWKF